MAEKTIKPKKISLKEAKKVLAWDMVDKEGLPRGQVIKLLDKHKVDPKLIQQVTAALVPYGCT